MQSCTCMNGKCEKYVIDLEWNRISDCKSLLAKVSLLAKLVKIVLVKFYFRCICMGRTI